MIRKVSIKGCKLNIDWDEEDYNVFFRIGLQKMANDHLESKRKIVVVPVGSFPMDDSIKKVEISDEFSKYCVELGVNHALREYLDKMENKSDIKPAKCKSNSKKDIKHDKSTSK